MEMRTITSPEVPGTGPYYANAKELTGFSRLLYISGQIPETADGHVPADFEDQARLVFGHIVSLLKAADMDVTNLVKLTIYLSDRQYRAALSRVRNEHFAGHQFAMTIIIAGIYDPIWLLEVEAVAAD
ncbi:RidA family protein [Sphaerisporangium sp. NPDC051011]|uniref:RidA family protein n=1 Tax=Sphaerisporangium sp. NPDC051011 TaxID=3155792 RepID=UPI0033F738C5